MTLEKIEQYFYIFWIFWVLSYGKIGCPGRNNILP